MVDVSVIIPTRNRAAYLHVCLETLVAQQSGTSLEVVVVDNGSDDATPDVIRSWSEGDARIRGVVEPILGISAAKNAGAAAARGELLLFTDDDILVAPGWVEAYVRLFARRRGEPVLAGGPLIPVAHDLGPWPSWFVEEALPDIGALDHGTERLLGAFEFVWGANMAVPATVFSKVGGFDESLGRRGDERGTYEDVEYQERLKGLGGSVWFCPGAIARHRIERSAVTPRQVLRVAFSRGRDDVLREARRGRDHSVDGLSVAGRLVQLLGGLGSWVVLAAVLRVAPRRAAFARAHAASYRSGYRLDALRTGRESGVLSKVLGRAVRAVLRAASALAPARSMP